jgi:hypothetical protein
MRINAIKFPKYCSVFVLFTNFDPNNQCSQIDTVSLDYIGKTNF